MMMLEVKNSQRFGPRPADTRWAEPLGRSRRGRRHHGPEWVGQVDAVIRHRRQARLRGHLGRRAARRREPPRVGAGRARPKRGFSRLSVSDRDPRRGDDDLPEGRAERPASVARRKRSDYARLHAPGARSIEGVEDRHGDVAPAAQCRIFGGREEANSRSCK